MFARIHLWSLWVLKSCWEIFDYWLTVYWVSPRPHDLSLAGPVFLEFVHLTQAVHPVGSPDPQAVLHLLQGSGLVAVALEIPQPSHPGSGSLTTTVLSTGFPVTACELLPAIANLQQWGLRENDNFSRHGEAGRAIWKDGEPSACQLMLAGDCQPTEY